MKQTLRELSGWCLWPLVWLFPPVFLVFSGTLLSRSLRYISLPMALLWFVGALIALALPQLWLLSVRLREPPLELDAEADGRPAILLLHRSLSAKLPLWSRLFFPQKGARALIGEHRYLSRLARQVLSAGPLTHLQRPAPAPESGRVRPALEAGWKASLERRLASSRMALISLDGSVANEYEIRRALEILGPDNVRLLFPASLPADSTFWPAYDGLAERLPFLPTLRGFVTAIRFSGEASDPKPEVLSASTARHRWVLLGSLLRDSERGALPARPPSWAVFLPFLPLMAALATALFASLVARGLSLPVLSGGDSVTASVALVAWAAFLTPLARRTLRLRPSNPSLLVFFAALPWLVFDATHWLEPVHHGRLSAQGIRGWVQWEATIGLYFAPLFFAVGLLLIGGSLLRKSPGRRPAFALFGMVSLVPYTLIFNDVLSTTTTRLQLAGLATCFAAAVLAGLCAWSASGESQRSAAPLGVAAMVAIVLGLVTSSFFFSQRIWQSGSEILLGSAFVWPETGAAALVYFTQLWPVLLLPPIALALLIGAQFRGRLNRSTGAELLALVPLIVLATSVQVMCFAIVSMGDWTWQQP